MNKSEIEKAFASPRVCGRKSKHPFSKMEVGEIVDIKGDLQHRAKLQVYCHVYGRKHGSKFQTRTIDEVLYVKRVA